MKVLLAATSSESFSGASKCLVELADQLEKRNFDVTVLLPRHGDLEENLSKKNIKYTIIKQLQCWYIGKNEKIRFLKLKYLFNKLSILKTIHFINKNNFDVVHVNASTAYVPGVAAEKAGIPVIWHLRESLDKDLGIEFTNPHYSYSILSKANRMIAISNTIKDVWKKRVKSPISVVYDGVPIQNYFIKRNNIGDNEKNSNRIINIGIYGRITPGKGQLFFFEGIKKFINLGVDNIHVSWAGIIEDKEYYQQIVQYISDNGLDEYQEYIGQISDVKSYLSSLDLVCVCSKYEGFGRVTVESQIAGCIVLGADIGATTEIIRDNENGFLYKQNDLNDFVDKLSYIINHLDSARKIALVGQKEAIEKYSIEADVNKVIGIYREVLESK